MEGASLGSPFMYTIIFSAILMLVILGYAVIYRRERGVRYFIWVLVCRVIYAGSVILELSFADLSTKLLLRSMQQTTLVFIVPFMILFVLDLHGMDKWLKPSRRWSLLALFACWALVIWTDPYTSIVYNSVALIDGHLVTTRTLYSIAFNIFCYAVIALCIYALVRYIRSARPEIRKAGIWLLFIGSIPMVVEILKLIKPGLSFWLHPVSVYTGICGIFMLWIILREKLFSSVPIGRSMVVDAMQEGFIITNKDGIIIDSNKFAQMLMEDEERGSILGQRIENVLHVWPEWLSACIQMKEARIEIRSPHREDRSYMINVYPYFSQSQRKLGMISMVIDITEKQQALEQIARLNQMKDQLLTIVSHDIRNPLALQLNLVELIEKEQDSSHQVDREIVQALSEQIRNTYSMVDNLLEWFRSQKEGIVLNPESLSVAEIVEEVRLMMLMSCELKQLTLNVQVDESLRVNIDREAFVLIIRNLLSNAIKFSKQGGTVVIRAEAVDRKIEVTVQDDGIGMNEEQIRDVFDDTRLDTTLGTFGEKGTGLGLFVCRQFLRLSDGYLKVASSPNGGSRFTAVLEEGTLK